MRWNKDPKRDIWRLRGKGLRRGRGPVIMIYGRGQDKFPPAWHVQDGNLGFETPEHLQRYIDLLQNVSDKWERLRKRFPEVKTRDQW